MVKRFSPVQAMTSVMALPKLLIFSIRTVSYTHLAVERNGDIVTKVQYSETVLTDGDSIEVVSFVGGG